MKKITKILILSLLIVIFIKIILASLVLSPSAFSDEYTYSKMAKSFFYSQEFTVHEIPTKQYLPLYPIILSLAYIYEDMQIVYLVMKIINSIISSLIIIPSFLIAKEFISEKRALITAFLISLYPSNFSFAPLIMAENLFYPLFLFTIYFIYKEFTENNYKWSILSGIFIGLTTLTKINGLIFIPIIIIISLYKIIIKEFNLKKLSLTFIMFFITIAPWILRNAILFNFSLQNIFGVYSVLLRKTDFYFSSFLTWIIIYIGTTIISTGFIYTTLNLNDLNFKENVKLKYFRIITLLSLSFTIIMIANLNAHSPYSYNTLLNWLIGRPTTRTIDAVIPLFIINGIINLNAINRIKKHTLYLLLLTLPIILITTQIAFLPLLPFNNMSLVLLGIFSHLIKIISTNLIFTTLIFSILFTLLFSLSYYMYIKNKMTLKNIIIITLLLFLLSNIANYALITYNANTYWHKDEQIQLSLWFNEYDKGKSTILIDDKDIGKISKIGQIGLYNKNIYNNETATKIGFFMNNKILIGNVSETHEVDYILSTNKLNLPVIKSIENRIFVHKV